MKYEEGEIKIRIRFDENKKVVSMYNPSGDNIPLGLFCEMLRKLGEAKDNYNRELEEEEEEENDNT